MSDITYSGDAAGLTMGRVAVAEIIDSTSRALVHGVHWDGNASRLTFDPGDSTEMELTIRPAARWPRLGRRANRLR